MDRDVRVEAGPEVPGPEMRESNTSLTSDISSSDEKPKAKHHEFNEQTHYVPVSTIVTIFLAAASVDFLALMDQTTLAASLTIVSNALDAGDEQAWIAGAYFVSVYTSPCQYRLKCHADYDLGRRLASSCSMVASPTFGLERSFCTSASSSSSSALWVLL